MCAVGDSVLVAVYATEMDSVGRATATGQLKDVVFVDRVNNGKSLLLEVSLQWNVTPTKI